MSYQTKDYLDEPGYILTEGIVSSLFPDMPSFNNDEIKNAVIFINQTVFSLKIKDITYLIQAEEDFHSLDPAAKRVTRQYLKAVILPPEVDIEQLKQHVEDVARTSSFPDETRYSEWKKYIQKYGEIDSFYRSGKGKNGDIIFRLSTPTPVNPFEASYRLNEISQAVISKSIQPLFQRSIAPGYKPV